MNGDHLQQGISGRQPPPHHGLSGDQRSKTGSDCSQPGSSPPPASPASKLPTAPSHPSRVCSCLVSLHSRSSTPTRRLPTDDSDLSHLQQGFALLVLIFAVKLDVQFLNQFSRLLFLEVHDCIENLERQQQLRNAASDPVRSSSTNASEENLCSCSSPS